jgi:CheY-like chemotaxis protein
MGTVFVVDDIAGNARLLESLLAPDGHTAHTAGERRSAMTHQRAAGFEVSTRPEFWI